MRSAPAVAALAAIALAFFSGCPNPEAPATTASGTSSAGIGAAPVSAAPSPSAVASANTPRELGKPYLCGPLTCRDFESAPVAIAAILEETKPSIVAFGEGHALKGTQVPSTTARFTADLLPLFKDKASALVLELWVPDPKCGKEKIKQVEQKQKVITEKQAETNQNEYVKLGEKSREVGVVPFLLKPSCEDFDKVKAAGNDPGAIALALVDVIARNMKQKATTLFDETTKKAPGKMLLTYGGGLHNDIAPKPGRESWSYAADLEKLAPGKYVELDLIVPEFIKDNETWASLPWYAAYDREKMGGRVVVITVAPCSYTLVFATTSK